MKQQITFQKDKKKKSKKTKFLHKLLYKLGKLILLYKQYSI